MGDALPLVRQAEVARALRAFLPARALLWEEEDTRPYECDGLTAYRQLPLVVALPETEEQVRRVLETCSAMKVPVVARGAGTGLSGGAMPPGDGVLLSLAKFNRMLRVDRAARGPPWCSPACAMSRSAKRPRPSACTTRPIRRARSPAPSAATWPRTRAACTA